MLRLAGFLLIPLGSALATLLSLFVQVAPEQCTTLVFAYQHETHIDYYIVCPHPTTPCQDPNATELCSYHQNSLWPGGPPVDYCSCGALGNGPANGCYGWVATNHSMYGCKPNSSCSGGEVCDKNTVPEGQTLPACQCKAVPPPTN